MAWERCGNLPYWRKSIGRMVFYANPFNWSQVIVSAERQDEWAGVAPILYRKAPRYDWDALKRGAEKVIKPEDRMNVLRATHEWGVDRMKAEEAKLPTREVIRLFKAAKTDVQEFVLEGVGSLIVGYGGGIQNPVTVVAIEKNSPAYADIADLREVYDYAEKFFIASTLDQAISEALDYLGIYEC
jgi:hypothetical protein